MVKKTKKKFVKICPNCGSTRIKLPPAGLDCKLCFKDSCIKCGHIGNFPEIEEKKIKEFQKKLKKNKLKPSPLDYSPWEPKNEKRN